MALDVKTMSTFAMVKPVKTMSTFAMVKPVWSDSYKLSDVIDFIEHHHFVIEEMRLRRLTPSDVDIFYEEHVGKHFYEAMRAYTCSGPVVGMVLSFDSGLDEAPIGAVTHWRYYLGSTDSTKAESFTLRGLYGNKDGIMFQNVAHGSDSLQAAVREAKLWGWELTP